MHDNTATICMTWYELHMTSHPLYMISLHAMTSHTLYTPTILDIMSTVSVTSHQLYRWYHSHYMYDITSSICETFCPLYLWHHTHYVWDHNPVCWLHQLGICMTSFALQKPSHTLYRTKPQSLWLHIHFRHDITPPVSDIAPTVSLSLEPLHWYHTHFCMTSHPLYLWHHMHYI